MIQHLLNTTAIWLLCLLAFDLFLRKETFHAYNRFYLLITLVVGLLFPFWEWSADSAVLTTTFCEPVTYVADARQSIVTAAGKSSGWDMEMYLSLIYAIGAFIAFLLLIIDIAKVLRLYRIGVRQQEGNWIIITTRGEHSPFSIFNFLFVNSREQYSPAQWAVLLSHEQQHRQRFHFFDLLLMQLIRVLFWFHPLVYLYNKRLLMVHEYEADSAVNSPLNEYGRFLVEQALLGNAPVITHSFNRSPIKKRITMLTRNSTRYKKIKLFIGLPIMLASMLFFTQCANSPENKVEGNVITYNGNKIELNEGGVDTIEVIDPVSGETQRMYEKREPSPVTFNGKKVHSMQSVDRKPAMKGIEYGDYLRGELAPVMETLSDGTYQVHISNMILDEKGKLVYYDFKGISKSPANGESAAEAQKSITDEVNKSAAKAVADAFDGLPINPAQVSGEPVIAYLDDFSFTYFTLEVKGHKVQ